MLWRNDSQRNSNRGDVNRLYVHAKVMNVDALAVSIGSANLDVTAIY